MHFANCTGFAHNSAFEHATTAKTYSARMLGRNDAGADITLPNEIEYSLSGNTSFTFTEDFNLRCRKISLHYSEEDANSRVFTHPDLHGWILEHREELLSALAGLIAYWDQQNRPQCPTPFTSFPEWAAVVGGIMVCCGLGDPCQPQLDSTLTADNLTEDMKKLFSIGFQWHPDQWLDRNRVKDLVMDNPDMHLFGWLDLEERSGQTSFGLRLKGFEGRILDGIQLVTNNQDKRRPKYKFTQHLQPTNHAVAQQVFTATTKTECAPCQPCQPFPPHSTLDDNNPLCYTGEKVLKVHKVDNSSFHPDQVSPVVDTISLENSQNYLPQLPPNRVFPGNGAIRSSQIDKTAPKTGDSIKYPLLPPHLHQDGRTQTLTENEPKAVADAKPKTYSSEPHTQLLLEFMK